MNFNEDNLIFDNQFLDKVTKIDLTKKDDNIQEIAEIIIGEVFEQAVYFKNFETINELLYKVDNFDKPIAILMFIAASTTFCKKHLPDREKFILRLKSHCKENGRDELVKWIV